MPLPGSRGERLAELQEALKQAELGKDNTQILQKKEEIKKFKAEDEAGWYEAFKAAAKLRLNELFKFRIEDQKKRIFVRDPIKSEFKKLTDQVSLTSTTDDKSIELLRKEVSKLIDSNEKSSFSSGRASFGIYLKEFKESIDAYLYPRYGAQINQLEDYIQKLREEGVTETDKRKVKTVIFRSDRTEKLKIAENLKKQLIEFESKTPAEQANNPITPEAIQRLIDKNAKATGSTLLHSHSSLDDILKSLKERIEPQVTSSSRTLRKD